MVFVVDKRRHRRQRGGPAEPAETLNYECVNCLTYALARQLFVTLDEPLSESQKWELRRIWWEMKLYEAQIKLGTEEPEEIEVKLDGFNGANLGGRRAQHCTDAHANVDSPDHRIAERIGRNPPLPPQPFGNRRTTSTVAEQRAYGDGRSDNRG